MTKNVYDNSILECFNDKDSPLSEKLFALAKYYSFFFLDDSKSPPNEFEKKEAIAFAWVYMVKILASANFKLTSELKIELYAQAQSDLIMNVDIGRHLWEIGEYEDFCYNRWTLYVSEINKMTALSGYNCVPILDKLYKNPLSPNSARIIYKGDDTIEHFRLWGEFKIAIKAFEDCIVKSINLLQMTENKIKDMENIVETLCCFLSKLQTPFKAKHLWGETEPNLDRLNSQYHYFLGAYLTVKLQIRYNLADNQVKKFLERIADYHTKVFKMPNVNLDSSDIKDEIDYSLRLFYPMVMHLVTSKTQSLEVNGDIHLFEDILSSLYFHSGYDGDHDYFRVFISEFLRLKNDFFMHFGLIDAQLNEIIQKHQVQIEEGIKNLIEIKSQKTAELGLDLNSIRIYNGQKTTVGALKASGWTDEQIEKYAPAKAVGS